METSRKQSTLVVVNASDKSAVGNEAAAQRKRVSEEDQSRIDLVMQDMKAAIKEGSQNLGRVDIY